MEQMKVVVMVKVVRGTTESPLKMTHKSKEVFVK